MRCVYYRYEDLFGFCLFFFFSSRRRHTRCALVTGVQTCALPISVGAQPRDGLYRRGGERRDTDDGAFLRQRTLDRLARRGRRRNRGRRRGGLCEDRCGGQQQRERKTERTEKHVSYLLMKSSV